MLKLYTNIFDSTRQKIWDNLHNVPVVGTLGGGTAIALQLNHRVSYDFDIFLVDLVPKNLLLKIKSVFSDSLIYPQVDSGDELTITIDNVRTTYLYYPFASLYPTQQTSSLPLFDLRDIAADKAYTVGRRGAWRDYFDLYTLCTTAGFSLDTIITDAEKKFGSLFSPKLFIEQLTYSGDISDFSITLPSESDATPEIVIDYFKKEAAQIIED